MRNVFAVFDTEQEYAFRLMEYLNCRKNMPFEVQMFTSPGALISFTGKRHVDLLLVSERAAADNILNLPVGKIVVLSEGECPERLEAYPSVCKYQSAGQVVREVMDFYSAEKDAAAPPKIMKSNVRRIGVVSTCEPGIRTAFAIALGGVLSEHRSVLLASLDPWTGSAGVLSGEADRTMSELLYYYRQGKKGLIYCADSMVRSIRGMHYIPPASHPGDLLMMQADQWSGFFGELLDTGSYDTLILDIGSGLVEPEGILSFCSEIYMPMTGNVFSKRAAEMLQMWAGDNQAEWKDRLQPVVIDEETCEDYRRIFASDASAGETNMPAEGTGPDGTDPGSGLYERERVSALRSGRMGQVACRLEHERICRQSEPQEVGV